MAQTIVIPRNLRDEVTFAVLRVEGPPEVITANEVYRRLKDAISEWARSTEAGREALRNSCFDFNIGDLALEIDSSTSEVVDQDLRRIIQDNGIEILELEVISGVRNVDWTFDMHLFDEELEEELEEGVS